MTESRRRFFRRLQIALVLCALVLASLGLIVLTRSVLLLNRILGPMAQSHQVIVEAANSLERDLLLSRAAVDVLSRDPSAGLERLLEPYRGARTAFATLQALPPAAAPEAFSSGRAPGQMAKMDAAFQAIDGLLADLEQPDPEARAALLAQLDDQIGALETTARQFQADQYLAQIASADQARTIVRNQQTTGVIGGLLLVAMSGLLFYIVRYSLHLTRQDNERFQMAASAFEGAVYDYDIDHNTLFWTDGLTKVFGYPLEAVESTLGWWLDHIHPDDRERVQREIAQQIERGQNFSSEYRFQTRDGRYRDVWDRGQAVVSHRRVVRMVGVVVDITERRQTEEALRQKEALRQSEARFRSLVQNSSDVITVLAPDGTILYQSPSVEKVLGFHPDEMIGRSALERVHPDDQAAVQAGLLQLMETPTQPMTTNFRYLAADSRWVHLEAVGSYRLDDPGVRGMVINSRDVTERVRAQQTLSQQNTYLAALQETTLGLVRRLDIDSLLQDIMKRAGDLVGTSHTFVFLLKPNNATMVMRVASGIHRQSIGYRLSRGEGMAGRVWETGQTVVINDYAGWADRMRDVDYAESLHAMIGMPLKSGTQVVGVLGLAYTEPDRRFGENEIGILNRFAQLAAIALDNAWLYDAVQQELFVRKDAEVRLLEAEARYRTLVEQLPAMSYTVEIGPTNTITYVSPQVRPMLGYTPAEWMTDRSAWMRVLHPDDRHRVVRAVRDHLTRGTPLNIEYRARTRDGRTLWFRNQSTLVRDEDGRPQIAHGIMFDITEQKRSEEALSRSEFRNRALLDAIPDLMFLFSREGVFLDCKRSGGNLLLPPEQFLGKNIADVLPPELARQSLHHIQETLRSGKIQIFEYQLPSRDELRDYEARYMASGSDEVLAIVRDITRRKRSEEELARARDAADAANRAKSAFLANMSHELRTPLNAIIGYGEMLWEEMRSLKQDHVADDLEKITTAGRHLLALINDILDLSKIEAGKMQLYVEAFDVIDTIEQSLALIRPLAEQNDNRLQVHYEPDLGHMVGDETKVRQSLYNLLSNACKFTEHGTVTLEAAVDSPADRGWIVFRVRDTGIGIAPGELRHLFQDFTQADPSTTRKYGGTGLGLAITRRFVELMGGEVAVASEPGKGSTFTIRLPREIQAGTNGNGQTPLETPPSSVVKA